MNDLFSKVETLFLAHTSIGNIFKILSDENYSREEIAQALKACEKKYIRSDPSILN